MPLCSNSSLPPEHYNVAKPSAASSADRETQAGEQSCGNGFLSNGKHL